MKLDIRMPLGLLFVVLGALLTAFGAMSSPAIYHRSLNVNVNLCWGAVLLLFGATTVAFGQRSHRRAKKVTSPLIAGHSQVASESQ